MWESAVDLPNMVVVSHKESYLARSELSFPDYYVLTNSFQYSGPLAYNARLE